MADFLKERREITDMCRRLSDQGYLAGTGGNIGLRLDDRLFAVTPTAADYETMDAEDVVVLRLDTLEQVAGEKKPSVEKGLHRHMLTAWPDRRASLHTHQPIASAVALLREILPWPAGSPAEFGLHIGLIPYRPSGTRMLAKSLEKSLRPDIHAYLLASHGVICAAATLQDAADLTRGIEAAAALHLRKRIQQSGQSEGIVRQLIAETLERAATSGV